jgi:hypothetical protein
MVAKTFLLARAGTVDRHFLMRSVMRTVTDPLLWDRRQQPSWACAQRLLLADGTFAYNAGLHRCERGKRLAHTFSSEDIMSEPTKEELLARIAELEKQAGGSKRSGSLEFRVGEKGGVSVYGLGRFPVTLYYEQWIRLLDTAENLRTFLEENKHRLKLKTKE